MNSTAAFPPAAAGMVMVLRPDVKELEMQRFASGETHILHVTTVIEVGWMCLMRR